MLRQKTLIILSLSFFLPHLASLSEAYDLTPKQRAKYNTRKAWCYRFGNPQTLENLKRSYHKLKLPKFIDDLMQLNSHAENVQLYQNHPTTVSWTEDKTFIFQLNPPHLTADHKENLSRKEILKYLEGGLSLIGYYYHPNLINYSRFYNDSSRGFTTQLPIRLTDVSTMTYESIEERNVPYMVSLLDLRSQDVPYLKEIEYEIQKQLQSVYGITATDQVKLYFHFPYLPSTTSLHLHIRINQGSHGLERSRSFDLDAVIDALEKGKSPADMIHARSTRNNGCIYMDAEFKKGPHCHLPADVEKTRCYPPNELKQGLSQISPPLDIEADLVDNPFYSEE